ncbi:hypothetical protein V3W47_16455 [Deinococcus sp. YIM 134068]|uniref:hypothetical protein n=1 Tax=Deinococcus lichenicola TaxID=3118910 RepID=UPI002F9484CA
MTDPTDRDMTAQESTLGDNIDQETLEEDVTATAEDIERDSREPSDAELRPVGGESITGAATMDYSLPGDGNPANQDDQSNADLIMGNVPDEEESDLPVSGQVSGVDYGDTGTDALAGAGALQDEGIDPSLRVEMLDNAMSFGDDFVPNNVNDDPGFDDGVPGSFSDFSVTTPGESGSAPRLADPSQDAGGEVKGARVAGSGGIDGGPPRTTPLPGTEQDE